LNTLAQVKAHYEGLPEAACREAGKSLRAAGIDVRLMRASRRAFEYVREHWDAAGRHPTCAHWNWEEICRSHRAPKTFDLAIWTPDERLAGLALATLTAEAAIIRRVEGDPRDGCALKGKRVLIALEAVSNYALGAGLRELRVEPVNAELASLYERVYGFELHQPKKATAYYRKAI